MQVISFFSAKGGTGKSTFNMLPASYLKYVLGKRVGKLVFTFDKIALTKGQVFRVYFYENGGARNLTLNINDVNKAKRL